MVLLFVVNDVHVEVLVLRVDRDSFIDEFIDLGVDFVEVDLMGDILDGDG